MKAGVSGKGRGDFGTRFYVWLKGILDRVLALVILVVLSPLLALIALAVRVDSPGNPIFSQERVGKSGRLFRVYKFRSMYANNDDSKFKAFLRKFVQDNASSQLDEDGRDVYELVNDPRITRIGALLRRTNIDEIPQLVNVLKGEMALIGPRPEIPFTVEMYQPQHRQRLLCKPGITGLWQVSHRREVSFEDMVKLDIDYMRHQSLLLDAKIAFLTVYEPFRRDHRKSILKQSGQSGPAEPGRSSQGPEQH